MRFPEFLRATTQCSAASATLLAALTLAGVNSTGDTSIAYLSIGWWALAGVTGIWLGRLRTTSEQIASLLASARTQMNLPELHPSRTLLNRLWPLIVLTVGAGAVAVLAPQVPGIACGFAVIWALYWRHQPNAVSAIEERDGARFYVERTSPWRAIKLVRTPGFRTDTVKFTAATNGASRGTVHGASGPLSVVRRRMTR